MDETANTIEQPAIARADETTAVQSRRIEIAIWLAVCVVSSALISVVRWPTMLGVQALPWFQNGHEYPWRVWWRARDQYLNTSRHTLLYLTFGAALVLVFLGTALVCWLLLINSQDEPRAATDS